MNQSEPYTEVSFPKKRGFQYCVSVCVPLLSADSNPCLVLNVIPVVLNATKEG